MCAAGRGLLTRRGIVALGSLLLFGALALLGVQTSTIAQTTHKLRVVTTVAPHADLIRQIGGEHVEVVQLVPDGTDSHTFEPRPSDARFIQQADLVVLNGLHLETPTQRLADANKRAETPLLLLGDNTISADEWIFDFSFPAAQGDPNPHLWLSLPYARNYALLIKNQLVAQDPPNEPTYQANFDALAGRLDLLDAAIVQATQALPQSSRKLLTYHDSWAYFARRYGFEVIGAIQPSDFSEPSPREVGALVDQVRQYEVPAIFGSEVYPSRVLEVIGRETGARYVDKLRDDELPGKPGEPNHTYLGLMLEDMRTIFAALGGRTDMFDGLDPSPVS
jgi:ABC-type Zn uptake system ZnuABC Zn-binding protein ZnuA